jgi:hypothetical protein
MADTRTDSERYRSLIFASRVASTDRLLLY